MDGEKERERRLDSRNWDLVRRMEERSERKGRRNSLPNLLILITIVIEFGLYFWNRCARRKDKVFVGSRKNRNLLETGRVKKRTLREKKKSLQTRKIKKYRVVFTVQESYHGRIRGT